MPKQTVSGACHCGNIKYTVELDIPEDGRLPASRCNCTFCQKPGLTNIQPPDSTTFKLISPSDRAELGDYNPNKHNAHKYFCKTCGCHVWAEGEYEYEGQKVKFFTVNLGSVNQPQEGLELSKVKLSYWDGRNNNWAAGLQESACPGGLP